MRSKRSIKKLGTVPVQAPNELADNSLLSQKKGSIKIMRPLDKNDYASSISLAEPGKVNDAGDTKK